MQKIRRIWTIPLFSSVILPVPFLYPNLGFLAFFGLAPFLFFIYKVENLKKAFWTSWLAGFVFYAIVLEWFLSAFPTTWAGINDESTGLLLILFVWLASSAVMGLSFAFFGAVSYKLKTVRYYDLFIIPSIWIISQYLAAWLFSFYSWGPGGSIGAHWILGNLGLALVGTPAVFWARAAGMYGVSFIAVFFNVLTVLISFRIANAKRKIDVNLLKLILIFLGAVAVFIFLPSKIFKIYPKTSPLNIAVVQESGENGVLHYNAFKNLFERSGQEGKIPEQPDIIVFPEGAQIFSFFGEKEGELLKNIFPDQERAGLIITSITKILPEKTEERKSFIIYRDQKGGLIDQQEKSFLVPTGEFMPLVIKAPLVFFGKGNILSQFNNVRTLTPGKYEERPVRFGEHKIGALLCSGIITPVSYRLLALDGADIFINSASQNIFSGEPFLTSQIRAIAIMQAVSHAKPFVQSTNGGESFFVDQNGKTVWESGFLKTDIEVLKVRPSSGKSIYTRLGDWPLIFAIFAIFGSIFIKIRSHQTPNTKYQILNTIY